MDLHKIVLFESNGFCEESLDKRGCSVYNGSMDYFPTPLGVLANRQTLAWLLVPVLFLPVVVTILFLFGRVFAFLGDAFSASILDGTALVFCIVWCLTLVLLLLCTVFMLLWEKPEDDLLQEMEN